MSSEQVWSHLFRYKHWALFFEDTVMARSTVQCWYHVPRSWLKPTQNILAVFKVLGGDVTEIALVKRLISGVCSNVSESHTMVKSWHMEDNGQPVELHRPKGHLQCASGQSISAIKFAGYGTPSGTYGSFVQGQCHSPKSYHTLEKGEIRKLHASNYNLFKVLGVYEDKSIMESIITMENKNNSQDINIVVDYLLREAMHGF